ncbi:MAG: FAD-binding domain-containing protein [Amaricoccus sp.]|uniref:FAD-binding domain-containing protein n=1 Tax=Amaricoccus sp. TaxID=1872485 RepID=UPI0039E529BC
MRLKIDVRLDYAVEDLTTILLQIKAAARADQRILDAKLDIRAPESFSRFPGEDLVGERAWVRVRDRLRCHYRASVEVDRAEPDLAAMRQVPTHEVPGDVVRYLMESRYVPSEAFQGFVDTEFAGLSGGALALAIRDWVKAALSYVPGSGPDAAPYFRVFSPVRQAETYDPDGAYRRRLLDPGEPDARAFFDAAPRHWKLDPGAPPPEPLIEAGEGRKRALAAYEAFR